MRNSCMNTQFKLRKFGIPPESLPRVVVSRRRDALKMRGSSAESGLRRQARAPAACRPALRHEPAHDGARSRTAAARGRVPKGETGSVDVTLPAPVLGNRIRDLRVPPCLEEGGRCP
eukprot:2776002-Pyramimonas_sp.AAC.1